MQPYFFPYLGYWQLMNCVDKFIIYDDVNYIKGGWINRNRILINNEPAYITVPLINSSSFKKISDIEIQHSSTWRDKLIKKIYLAYRKAEFFHQIFPVLEEIILHEENNLSKYLTIQLQVLSDFMGIKADIVPTSAIYQNNNLYGQERILDICRQEQARVYLNLQGGLSLYKSEDFIQSNVRLSFISMHKIAYQQKSVNFFPSLSIIDALMHLGVSGAKNQLNEFDLISQNSILSGPF